MCTAAVPASAGEAFGMLESLLGSLAGQDPAGLPAAVVAERLRALERADAVGAALRGRYLDAFDAQDGPVSDGQRTSRTWLVHSTRVTRVQAAEHKAVQALARQHPVLLAALAEGHVLTKSVALQLARWTRAIPAEYRAKAEEIVVTAARAGADLRALAAICAEMRWPGFCIMMGHGHNTGRPGARPAQDGCLRATERNLRRVGAGTPPRSSGHRPRDPARLGHRGHL